MNISPEKLKAVYAKKGYPFEDSGNAFDPIIFGVRNADLTIVDKFNDWIGMYFRDKDGKEYVNMFEATTKPGLYYLQNAFGDGINRTGIVKEGFHKQAYMSRYPVMGVFPFKLFKDKNGKALKFYHQYDKNHYALGQLGFGVAFAIDKVLDGKIDLSGEVSYKNVGANIHSTRKGYKANKVWNWSAMCQVILDFERFQSEFMTIIDYAFIYYETWIYDYALFNELDFKQI